MGLGSGQVCGGLYIHWRRPQTGAGRKEVATAGVCTCVSYHQTVTGQARRQGEVADISYCHHFTLRLRPIYGMDIAVLKSLVALHTVDVCIMSCCECVSG